MEIYEIEVTNVSINKFYEIFDNYNTPGAMNGWEIVVNDGKFYIQREMTN